MAAGAAAAVYPPTIDAVKAAPRGILDDLDLMRRRMPLEVLPVIRQLGEFVGFDVVQSIRQRHVAETVVVAIAFTVRGDMNELRPVALFGKSPEKPIDEVFAAREAPFER